MSKSKSTTAPKRRNSSKVPPRAARRQELFNVAHALAKAALRDAFTNLLQAAARDPRVRLGEVVGVFLGAIATELGELETGMRRRSVSP